MPLPDLNPSQEPNYMTSFTEMRLKRELEIAEANAKSAQEQIGRSMADKGEWHDNFAYDQSRRDAHIRWRQYLLIKRALDNVRIIEPRQEVDSIDIGNTVRIRFKGETVEEEFSLLGPSDSQSNPQWISFLSPLGRALLQKQTGDKVSYDVEDKRFAAEITNILPGQFNNVNVRSVEIQEVPAKPKVKDNPNYPTAGTITFKTRWQENTPTQVPPKNPPAEQISPPLSKETSSSFKKIPSREETKYKSIIGSLAKQKIPYHETFTKVETQPGVIQTQQTAEFVVGNQRTRITLITRPRILNSRLVYRQKGDSYKQNSYSQSEVIQSIRVEKNIDSRWIEVNI